MQNAMWFPEYSGSKNRVKRHPSGLSDAPCLPVPMQHAYPSLCIPCALTNHDFKQRLPVPIEGAPCDEHTPKAWVDDRRYQMVYRPSSHRAACTDCGEQVCTVYEPE